MPTIIYGSSGYADNFLYEMDVKKWSLTSFSDYVRTYTSDRYQIKLIGDFEGQGEILNGNEEIFSIQFSAIGDLTSGKLSGLDIKFSSLEKIQNFNGVLYNQNMTIRGSEISDTITGYAKIDKINGFSGDDIINGYSGNDIIFGGADDDVINGGAGKDKLYGGAGEDFFVYRNIDDSYAKNFDTIFDFEHTIDAIDVRGFFGMKHRDFDFIGTNQFDGDKGEIRYEFVRNSLGEIVTKVEVSANHALINKLVITLDDKIALTEIDFIF